ncbi:hypothetical protein KSF_098930 [Reticulibacter mediterranei]|uniref:Uncharacterized protein n=1 Tax=Reticulibacter mediterranei TaxID=2778369 RepID=A0A8J3IWL2_9CHLR|nr:hypothetical protein [Reticulibacter mediterranei]GHO99845.1 hypothetical protein KSF_098930 [Reticulibacter mediterranei]
MARKNGRDLQRALNRGQKNNVSDRYVGYRELVPVLLYEVKQAAGSSCNCPPNCGCDKDLYCRFINGKLRSDEKRRVGEIGRKIDNELTQSLEYRAEVIGNLEDGGKPVVKVGKPVVKGIVNGAKWFVDFVDKHWE